MTAGLLSSEARAVLSPEKVSPGIMVLVADDVPNRTILLAGGGSFECAHITMTQGIHAGREEEAAADVCHRVMEISDRTKPFPRLGTINPDMN